MPVYLVTYDLNQETTSAAYKPLWRYGASKTRLELPSGWRGILQIEWLSRSITNAIDAKTDTDHFRQYVQEDYAHDAAPSETVT